MRAVPALRGAWRLSPAAAGLVPGGGTRVGCVPLTAPMGTLDAGTAPEYTSSRLTYGAAAGCRGPKPLPLRPCVAGLGPGVPFRLLLPPRPPLLRGPPLLLRETRTGGSWPPAPCAPAPCAGAPPGWLARCLACEYACSIKLVI